MYLLDRSLIDNSTLLLNKRNLYKYDIIIIIIIILLLLRKYPSDRPQNSPPTTDYASLTTVFIQCLHSKIEHLDTIKYFILTRVTIKRYHGGVM